MVSITSAARLVLGATCAMLVGACSTPQVTNIAAASAGTVALGHAPTTNIGQTYYLGMFDPREQLPPTIYRIRIQGQASALSFTKFASGWVRADLIDSLSGRIDVDKNQVRLGEDTDNKVRLQEDKGELNRRLVMFGPEGFREAPKNHRLVVAMGSSPENFFNAVDRALGVVAGVTQPSLAGPDVVRAVWADMSRLREERRAMQTLIDLTSKD